MAGRLILDLPNPALTAAGKVDATATLTYYQNGTTTLQSIFADAGLETPLANPLSCNSAGRFPVVWADDAAIYSVKWTPTGATPITFDDIVPVGNTTNTFLSTPYAFGAIGDGDDDIAALNAWTTWLAANNQSGRLPARTFGISSTWYIPAGVQIFGDSQVDAVIKPLAGFTDAAAVDLNGQDSVISDIHIDGTNTTNVVGLRIGNTTLAENLTLRNVQVFNFGGNDGKGAQFINITRAGIYSCYFGANKENCDIGSLGTDGLPDTLHFYDTIFHSSTGGPGAAIKTVFEVWFINCTSEANQQAGYDLTLSASGVASGIHWIGGWCEGNWLSVASGAARHAKYHIDVNGTASGAAVNNLSLRGTYFNGSATECAAMHLNKVFFMRLDGPLTQQLAGAIVVDNAASSGWLDHYQGWDTYFTDNSGNIIVRDKDLAPWTSYTPVFASTAGNAATSFAGAITVSVARYKRIGQTGYISLGFDGTLNAVTPTAITAALPSGWTAQNTNLYGPAMVGDAGTDAPGLYRAAGTSIGFSRSAFAAFGSGHTFECYGTFVIELA